MVNILHVITGLNRGGAERMLQKVIINSDSLKYSHTVVSLSGRGVVGEELMQDGITVIPVNLRSPLKSAVFLGGMINALKTTDLILGWMYHGNLFSLILGKLFDIPVIWGIRRGRIDKKTDKKTTLAIYRLGAMLSKKPNGILYCSRDSQMYHQNDGYFSNKSIYIPNGIDTKYFKRSEDFRDDELRPTILMASRWSPLKGHRVLLEALSGLPQYQSYRVILCGNDIVETNTELVELIENYGLKGKIRLLGPQSNLPEVMSQCSIYVSASDVEAFPNTVAEAMACELFCIATDAGDSREIVDTYGSIIAPRDVKGLTMALNNALSMELKERKRIAQLGRLHICKNYDIHRIVEEYEQIFTDYSKDR